MADYLRHYPKYRDSGVSWLGEIPAHWEVKKLRNILKPIAVRRRSDLPLLSVVRERGVIPRDITSKEENHNFVPDDLSNYKVVRTGQFAMNKMKAWQGSYGVSRHEGIVSPAYFVFDLAQINDAFFHVAIRSRAYVPFFAQASDGVRIGQWDLSQSRMKEIPFAIPSNDEQVAIARFLDHTTRTIGKAIWAKQKLIKLLEEQKQAIIHRAVTRGLNQNVRLKLSGVEWLGDVPEHWEIRSFTRGAIERADYRGATPNKTESGIFLVTAKNIRKGWIDYGASREFVSENDYATIMRRGLPRIGDLLLTTEAPLGNAALVDREDVALAQRVIRFRMNPKLLDSEFVLHSVLAPYFQDQLLRRGTGSTALGIKASKLPQLQLLCPPLIEQRKIIDYVARECAPLDSSVAAAESGIVLLREYRTRLIADVVTGRLDVREAAARLPKEVDVQEVAEASADEEAAWSEDMDDTAIEEAEA